MAQPSLAPAGSSSYASDTMHVGDGTWDATQDTFLLPNIQGLNFNTMRYNGMGNRFRAMNGYTSLVTAHGVLAAITFLIIVPTAILTASFYHRNARLALRVHIGLQVLTVLLTTVIFVLGYFQVGPERSLTNPHHAIGLTIFLLVLVQAIGGWLIKRIEKGKIRYYIPVKLMLHQWLGRGIALLAFAQIPIGLALYGSPASLFIVYTLWMTFLLVLYFILVHQNHKRVAMGYDEQGSYTSGTRTGTDLTQSRRGGPDHHRLEQAAGAVGLGAALAALRRRSSGRRERYTDESDMTSVAPGNHGPGRSNTTEKFTDYSSDLSSRTKQHTWRNRFLGAGAGVGGLAAAKSLFGRRRAKSDTYLNSEAGSYARPPLGGPVDQSNIYANAAGGMHSGQTNLQQGGPQGQSNVYAANMTRSHNDHTDHHYDNQMAAAEEGRPLTQDDHWRQVEERERQQDAAMSRPDLQSRMSGDSYSSLSAEKAGNRKGRWGLPTSLGAIAGLGGLGEYWRRRRERKEDQRIASERQREHENESLYMGPNGQPRYTGDGTPRRNHVGRVGNDSPYADQTGSPSRHRNRGHHAGEGQSVAGSNMQSTRQVPQNNPSLPGQSHGHNNTTTAPIPPPSFHNLDSHSRPSTAHTSPSRRHHHHHRRGSSSNTHTPHTSTFGPSNPNIIDPHTPLSPPLAATAATTSLLSPPAPPYAGHGRHSRPGSSGTDRTSPHTDMNSPPVSVKVKMHNNGRHVTLRRLSEEEAAREREARRGQRRHNTRQDLSPIPAEPSSSTRPGFRRQQTGPAPRQSQQPQATSGTNLASPATGVEALGSSPGAYDTGTGTDVTDFESNRRRRRAERARMEREREQEQAELRQQGLGQGQVAQGQVAQAQQGRRRTGGGTGHVEFT